MLGTCGLAGLYIEPGTWRRSLPVWLLLACVVPLSAHLDVYLGFPARKLTAEWVAQVLGLFVGIQLDAGTVLLTESRAAYVDLPCSGVKSLWTTAVFLLAATAITRRGLDGVWLVIAALTLGLVFVANGIRVAILVVLETVAGWPLAAEILHRPLGILGFVLACGLGAACLLRRPVVTANPLGRTRRPLALAPVLVTACLFCWGLQPAVGETVASAPPAVLLPAAFSPLPVSPQEQAFAAEQGGAIRKGTVAFEGLTGAVLLVTSQSWRAQHLPQHCLEAHGVTLTALRPEWIDGHTVRYALADGPSGDGVALWWFQSTEQATDDYTARIWADLMGSEPWVLVSLLLDGHPLPSDPTLQRLVHDLGAQVQRSLQESS
jgi:exosortase O